MEVIIKYISPRIYKDIETQTGYTDLETQTDNYIPASDENMIRGCIPLDDIKNTIQKGRKENKRGGYWLRVNPLISLLKEHGIITTFKKEREFLISQNIIQKVQGSHYRLIDIQKYYHHYAISKSPNDVDEIEKAVNFIITSK